MYRLIVLGAALAMTGTGCSSNLSRFDLISIGGGQTSSGLQVTRSEAADQGSGNVSSLVGPGGHTVSRTTVGGSYLRRTGVIAATGGHQVSGGLHAKPGAVQ